MNSNTSQPVAYAARTLQDFFWTRPEWWIVTLSAFAWVIMLGHVWQHGAHGTRHWMTFSEELILWLVMTAAMMLPFDLDAVRMTAIRSLWARRHRAMAVFLLGYFGPWAALGLIAAAFRQQEWTHLNLAPAIFFAVAFAWQLTPLYRQSLVECHRVLPLAPSGWCADRGCIRFGFTIGMACVAGCWPLMLACTFSGHGLFAMTGGMAIGVAERWSFRRRNRMALLAALSLTFYYAALVGFENGLQTTSILQMR